MSDGEYRRLMPPPRRPPGPLGFCVRWRAEILLAAGMAGTWYAFGGFALGTAVLVVGTLLLVSRRAGRLGLGLAQCVIVPHRVRVGLVQAGVGDRAGRLPWLVATRPRDDAVHVTVWLRAGTTVHDLILAAPVIATACGALDVEVRRYSVRQDRALLVVTRPRWGWWTR